MPHPKITHLGAANCVTGSCHLIETPSKISILVDCGISQGDDPVTPFDRFPVPPAEIDYLFLTHAHIGRVPDLIYAGFDGEIICTHATKALLIPMLHDALSFTGRDKGAIKHMEETIDYYKAVNTIGNIFV